MSDNTYFVGDLVKIKDRKTIRELVKQNKIIFGWHPNMYKWCDKVFEISEIMRKFSFGVAYTFKGMPDEMKQYTWSADIFEPCYEFKRIEINESEIDALLMYIAGEKDA